MVEFKKFPKIYRDNPFNVTITEKIDGTNACVVIENDKLVGIQSRNKFITPDEDNYGFASWACDNEDQLIGLGDGYHYGEWAGEGIQRNPHRLEGKHFFLFNTYRWTADDVRPECCAVVPILYRGLLTTYIVPQLLVELQENAEEDETPEGVVVYYHSFDKYTKHTIKNPDGKWCKD
jgi:hypothetical protein